MESSVFKIVTICIVSAFLMLAIKNTMPSFAPALLIASGAVCFFLLGPYIENLITLIRTLGDRIDGVDKYVTVTVKITGIALLCEFASQMCLDVGENYLSSKIDIAGKVIIVSICAPEFLELIATVVDMISSI